MCVFTVRNVYFILTRQSDIKTRAMGALQNMLCGMDIELCGGSETVIAIWQDVMKLVVAGIVTLCDNVTGLLIVLVDMMKHTELEQVYIHTLVTTTCL